MFKKTSKPAALAVHILITIITMISVIMSPQSHFFVNAQAAESTPNEQQPTVQSEASEIIIEPDTLIETGVAAAQTEVYSIENINEAVTPANNATDETNTESVLVDEASPDTSTSTSSSTTPLSDVDNASSSSIAVENLVYSSTSATTTAQSGNNVANGIGATTIVTGDAYAYTNIVNLTNTNIVNSEGFILFLNQVFGMEGADVRDLFDIFSDGSSLPPCDTTNCEGNQLEYYLSNQTEQTNNISVSATTGDNFASGSTSAILSGDAYAAANITNIANTNNVDTNYMLLTFSNFGDLLGDIVLPGKHLLEKLFQKVSNNSSNTLVSIDNQAVLHNSIAVDSNTGNNTTDASSSIITTGNASTHTNVYNQINTNIIDDDSFTLLFRVAGNWDGQIFGLPDGLTWERTSAGISITNNPNFGTTALTTPATQMAIANTAQIHNTVSVSASTGNNHATGTDLAYIETGDAYAAANITNIANTNILGRNWSLLIFDIFGNWTGNISFGKPDLWIGGTANAKNGITSAGQEVQYTFTVSNLGDAPATNIQLNGDINSDLIALDAPLTDINLGVLNPGETIEKTFVAHVRSDLHGSHPIDLTARITATEPDENITNNTEVVTILAQHFRRGGGKMVNNTADIRPAADLVIRKTANTTVINPGDTVSYDISITNQGGPVFGATLYDSLLNSDGQVVQSNSWELETIDAGETVNITYSTEYSTDSPPGSYITRAQVLGYHKNRVATKMEPYNSMVATTPLLIQDVLPNVLGIASTTTSCTPYLSSYSRLGTPNDTTDVTRLQTFLNTHTQEPIQITGIFDRETDAAVRTFQQTYKDDILSPWGLTAPTGHVYYTTQKKINELYCEERITFPLNITQLDEIKRFKTQPETSQVRINNTAFNSTNETPATDVTPVPVLAYAPPPAQPKSAMTPPQSYVHMSSTPIVAEAKKVFAPQAIFTWLSQIDFPKLHFWNYF